MKKLLLSLIFIVSIPYLRSSEFFQDNNTLNREVISKTLVLVREITYRLKENLDYLEEPLKEVLIRNFGNLDNQISNVYEIKDHIISFNRNEGEFLDKCTKYQQGNSLIQVGKKINSDEIDSELKFKKSLKTVKSIILQQLQNLYLMTERIDFYEGTTPKDIYPKFSKELVKFGIATDQPAGSDQFADASRNMQISFSETADKWGNLYLKIQYSCQPQCVYTPRGIDSLKKAYQNRTLFKINYDNVIDTFTHELTHACLGLFDIGDYRKLYEDKVNDNSEISDPDIEKFNKDPNLLRKFYSFDSPVIWGRTFAQIAAYYYSRYSPLLFISCGNSILTVNATNGEKINDIDLYKQWKSQDELSSWNSENTAAVYYEPYIDDKQGGLYVCKDGYTGKFDGEGKQVWFSPLKSSGYNTQDHPTINICNNEVLVGFKSYVVALDKEKGKIQWYGDVGGSDYIALEVKGNQIFAYANGYGYKFDDSLSPKKGGKLAYTYSNNHPDTGKGLTSLSLIDLSDEPDGIVIAGFNGKVVSDRMNELQTFKNPRDVSSKGNVFIIAAKNKDNFYYGSNTTTAYSDINTNRMKPNRWEKKAGSKALLLHNNILVAHMIQDLENRTPEVLNAFDAETGQFLWRYPSDFPPYQIYSSKIDKLSILKMDSRLAPSLNNPFGNSVLFASGSFISCLSLDKGQVIWTKKWGLTGKDYCLASAIQSTNSIAFMVNR